MKTKKANPLTPRETEILEVLSNGGGEKHAAEVLGGSWQTIGTHVDRIRAKLGANTAAAAVAIALRNGWIE